MESKRWKAERYFRLPFPEGVPVKAIFPLILTPLILITLVMPATAQWDYSKHSIPLEEIRSALFTPEYMSPAEADKQLKPDEEIIGLVVNGVARAYPLRIMSWHELVNDEIAGTPYLVSW